MCTWCCHSKSLPHIARWRHKVPATLSGSSQATSSRSSTRAFSHKTKKVLLCRLIVCMCKLAVADPKLGQWKVKRKKWNEGLSNIELSIKLQKLSKSSQPQIFKKRKKNDVTMVFWPKRKLAITALTMCFLRAHWSFSSVNDMSLRWTTVSV